MLNYWFKSTATFSFILSHSTKITSDPTADITVSQMYQIKLKIPILQQLFYFMYTKLHFQDVLSIHSKPCYFHSTLGFQSNPIHRVCMWINYVQLSYIVWHSFRKMLLPGRHGRYQYHYSRCSHTACFYRNSFAVYCSVLAYIATEQPLYKQFHWMQLACALPAFSRQR